MYIEIIAIGKQLRSRSENVMGSRGEETRDI
jgi:hypothetical protein